MAALRLTGELVDSIIADAMERYPDEACGLIGGVDENARRVIAIKNVAPHPQTQYMLDPSAQIKALTQFETEGLEWIGVYHSHPQGTARPSLEDIRDATLHTPQLMHVIVGIKQQRPTLQAWHIYDGQVDPIEVLIGQQPSQAIPPTSRLEHWAILFSITVGILILLAISLTLLPAAPPLPTPQ